MVQPLTLLVCPHCFSSLKSAGGKLQCQKCKTLFPLHHGIPDFVSPEEKKDTLYEFYDEEYIIKNPKLDYSDAAWKAQAVSALIPEKTKKKPLKIIDIGCGSGEVLAELSTTLHVKSGVGVDLSLKHLQFAKKRNPAFSYIQSPANRLPFKDSSFDIGIMTDLLEHVTEVEQVLTETERVCKSLLIKVPLEGCLEGWLLRRMIPDFKDRYGHVQAFTLESLRRHINKQERKIVTEEIIYTPPHLIDWSALPLRAKFFYKIRLLLRLGGIHFYRRICPVWYIVFVE